MKIIGVTQARIGSTRLPGKVLRTVNGKTLLSCHLERALKSKEVTKWIVATTDELGSDQITAIADQYKIRSYKGDVNNVLLRFSEAVKTENPDYVVRVTADCPLLDPELIDQVVAYALFNNLNYCCTSVNYPDGVDVEIFRYTELLDANIYAVLNSDKEHVTPFIKRKESNRTKINEFACDGNFENIRLTVDEQKDLEAIEILVNRLGYDEPWQSYTSFIINNPSLFSNQSITRNEGYLKSIKEDETARNYKL